MSETYHEGLDTLQKMVADHLRELGVHPNATPRSAQEFTTLLERFKNRIDRMPDSVHAAYLELIERYRLGAKDATITDRLDQLRTLLARVETAKRAA